MTRSKQRAAKPAPAKPAARPTFLSRPVLGGLAIILAVGCGILGYLVANGTFGNSTQYLSITSCKVGVDGCEARPAANIHADFALFIDGKRVDFTQPDFASSDTSTANFDPDGMTVAAHKELTTWDSFFRTVGMRLSDSTLPGGEIATTCLTMPSGEKYCNTDSDTFKFYVNGVKVDGIDNTEIDDLDRVLVSYGPETPEQVVKDQLPELTAKACTLSDRCATPAP